MMTKCLAASCCLGLLALVAVADGFCYRKNPPRSQENAELLVRPNNYTIWVCVQSVNFTADLEKAPKAITQIWFSMSRIERLAEYPFYKFADKLVKIEIWSSGLKDIESRAFRGLKELKALILPRNELTVVRAAWFRNTPKLLELNLANNRIQTVELDVLKQLPQLMNFDLRGNELLFLPGDFVKQLPASLRHLNVFGNPLNYRQLLEVVEWAKTKDDKANELKLKELRHVFNMTRSCLEDKTIIDKSNEAIDKCVEEKMNSALGLPAVNQSMAVG